MTSSRPSLTPSKRELLWRVADPIARLTELITEDPESGNRARTPKGTNEGGDRAIALSPPSFVPIRYGGSVDSTPVNRQTRLGSEKS